MRLVIHYLIIGPIDQQLSLRGPLPHLLGTWTIINRSKLIVSFIVRERTVLPVIVAIKQW